MGDKPQGPIWIDMTDALMNLPVRKLVLLANLAMNRLDMRAIGEICHYAELDPMIQLCDDTEASHG